jgi:hypothetical protein
MYITNVLVPVQFCFQKGVSFANTVFSITDSVLKSINKKMCVGGIFCELGKGFDCISHEILLTKLHFHGIQGSAANWFPYCLIEDKRLK